MIKNWRKRCLAGVLALLTGCMAILNAGPIIAQENDPRDELDQILASYVIPDDVTEEEIVVAEELQIDIGAEFEPDKDLTKLTYAPDKVNVTFKEFNLYNDQPFDVKQAGVYLAVYHVEPVSGHSSYDVARKIIVREPESMDSSDVPVDTEADSEKLQTETNMDVSSGESEEISSAADEAEALYGMGEAFQQDNADSGLADTNLEETEMGTGIQELDTVQELDTEPTQTEVADTTETELPETEFTAAETQGETELTVPEAQSATETENLSDEELLDMALEESEDQETYDEESGLSLHEVLEQGAEAGIDLASLEQNETISFMVAAATGTKTVDVTIVTTHNYADYGLGSYLTRQYKVVFGGITATAYCVQPSKGMVGDGKYSITKLKDGKALAKVCYYGSKAAGDEGFFAEKHPDFSAGKRFIITHIAAAYANGSSDAFSGTNSTGKALAMELYNYCMEQPNIPDVDMSFSEADTVAYVEGDHQRTKEITFQADELQSVTMKLPSGVKLHNVTTGGTSNAGEDVVITGGTKFYLSAPLTQVSDVGPTWSSRMKGSITKDFSAYKITTGGSIQDLALVFGEGVDDEKFVDISVKWIELVTVNVLKKDNETGNGLAGAVFGIYADEGCTNLIAQLPATDAQGAASVSLVKTQNVMYLKEITVPQGYVGNEQVYPMDFSMTLSFALSVPNDRVKARIQLTKVDAETGTSQGDATLAGAVYGLYAREDIVHPDNKTGVLHHAGEQVATLTTDESGAAVVEDLYLGNYYFKEISPSPGYTLSNEEYDVACTYEGPEVPVVNKTCTVKETVIKQPFQLIKAGNNGKTDADLLAGVGFTTYLLSSLPSKQDGSYDFAAASPVVTGTGGVTEIFTDGTGHVVSIPLPFGTYIVRETTTPHNFLPVKDFIVRITENHPAEPQVWRVLLDDEFKAKLKIIKRDDETKKSVLLGGTEFRIYDVDRGKYVEQVTTYPDTVTHTSYFTDEKGYLILPNALKPGTYRIEEQRAPAGYTINKNYVQVVIDSDTMYYMDEVSQDVIVEAVYENHPVKGELTIYKTGEVLKDFDKDFEYEEQKLEDAKFEVYAAEDIYTPDYQRDEQGNRILMYAKDTLVATVVTDAKGKAKIGDLPLGRYRVQEVEAPFGYVLNPEAQDVAFLYEGQDVPVVNEAVSFKNERQRVQVCAIKSDALNDALLPDAVFGLYNREDILSGDKVIVSADTLLEEAKSGDDGKAIFSLDLPLGQYYVKETKAPAGYVSSDEVLNLDASYQGQGIPVIKLEAEKKNEPTVTEFTKSDVTTGVELDGAQLTVSDKKGNIIDSWVSERDKPHVIRRLVVGETYILREVMAPYGYLKAEEVEFTVADTAEIQKVEMKDEVPTAVLIVNKKGEFLDKVTLLDNAKGTVEHLFEYLTGGLSEVTFEVYAAEDIKAADGVSEDYYKADELVDTITTDGNGIAKLEGLPAGKYYIKEVETAHGFVLDEEPRYIDLSYRDQDTPIIAFDERWQNARQKVSVRVVKRERGTSRTLAGGIFGLFAKDDILSVKGKVLIEADTIIEEKTTDQNGEITFKADLPVDGRYYIRELYAPDGFATTDDIQEFSFDYAGQDEAEVKYEFVFEDDPTVISITKSDITTGAEIPGAHLIVIDEDANTIDTWVSGTEPHIIKELKVGMSYSLIETLPANGYATAESVSFTVQDTGEVQPVVMMDDVTKVFISKTDITDGSEIEGAKLSVLDERGTILESWISGNEPHYIEKLPIGNYRLREETAPDGYVVAEEVPFTVEDTGEIQTVKMEDERVKGKLKIRKVDSENKAPLEGVTFELLNKVTGKVAAEFVTDKEGKAESDLLPIAEYKNGKMDEPIVYVLREKKPLEGYEDGKEEEIVFSIEDSETTVIEVEKEIENTRLPGVPFSPQTGDDTNIVGPLVLALLSLAGVIMIALGMVRRRAKRA